MKTTLFLIGFALGIAARHFGPSLWAGGKVWVGRKLFPQINQ